MTLPIFMVFERHWDTVPKQVINNILPQLLELGYDTFCLEVPEGMKSKDIIKLQSKGLKQNEELYQEARDRIDQLGIKPQKELIDLDYLDLADLMKNYFSSKHFAEVTETFKCLPGKRSIKQLFTHLEKLSISVAGVDIGGKKYDEVTQGDPRKKIKKIREYDELRTQTFVKNLLVQKKKRSGVIFLCGLSHAEKLLGAFKKKNLSKEIVYAFPHSPKFIDKRFYQMKEMAKLFIWTGHNYNISTKKNLKNASIKLIEKIQIKSFCYTNKIKNENSHLKILQQFFKVEFSGYMKPSHSRWKSMKPSPLNLGSRKSLIARRNLQE